MKKIILILAPVITVVFLTLFFYNKEELPVEILYSNKPHKTKPEIIIASNKIKNLSIYENLYSEKNPLVIANILPISENPIQVENIESNNIDNIINQFLEESYLNEYKGIKIVLIDRIKKPPLNKKPTSSRSKKYIIDLGIFQTDTQALTKLRNLEKSYPIIKNYKYDIIKNMTNNSILYNLQLQNIQDFNTAISICDKLNKNNQECLIIN
jgi:hypothetical protein